MSSTGSRNLDLIATEVLDILDRWEDRIQGHHTQKREHTRRRLRNKMNVFLPGAESLAGECQEASSVEVWSRNISQSGICFIHPGQIKADRIIICLDPDRTGTHWFHADIVRSRPVHNDFWEFGARFIERAQM